MSRSVWGLSVLGFVALSFVACDKKDAAPVAAPEKVNEAKPQTTQANVEAKPEVKAEAKPEDKPEAKVEAKAEAKLEEKTAEKAETNPEDKAKAKTEAKGEKGDALAPSSESQSLVPASKNGILPKGAADKIVKAGARSVVHLLGAGGEPRSVLAYALAKGSSKPFRMGMDLEMAMKASGVNVPPTKVPRMALLFDFTTGDREASNWPIQGKVTKISVEPSGPAEEKIAEALRPEIEPMTGFGMAYLVDQQGRVHDLKMSWPKGIPQQAQQMMAGMSQSLESMTSPLPVEAVGIGASWEVIGRAAANGADLLQVSTFKLKERKGDVLKLDVSVQQFAANEMVAPFGMPPNAKAKLVSFAAKGSGTTVLDTKDVAPTDGTMAMTTSMSLEISMTMGGETRTEKTSIDTKTKVTYARPAP